MTKERTVRLNSLLKEVVTEVIRGEVRHPGVSELLSITRVDITKDLHYAKVYVSVIGDERVRSETLEALQSAAGFIAVNASKKVVMRHFPILTFILDDSVDKQMRIEEVLNDIQTERESRPHDSDQDTTQQ